MSIILRHPITKEITVFSKGADSSIMPLVPPTSESLLLLLLLLLDIINIIISIIIINIIIKVILRKWKERLSESSKGEWNRLLIHNPDAWLERGHGQMNFYLTQVMSSHGAFNAYLFRMKLAESPDCSNCDRRGRDDDAWHTPFEYLAFRLYQEEG